jgi:WD40 repeat protein
LRSLRRARQRLVEELGIEPGTEIVALERAVLDQDDDLLATPEPPAIADHCPYKGLAPYDVDDADAFFGRTDDVAECVERLRANPLLVVTGPSGCGKSSIARAGLVPALARAGHSVVVFVPGHDAEAAMAQALASSNGSPMLVVDQFEEVFILAERSSDQARSFCDRLAAYAVDVAPVVLTVRADHVADLGVDVEFARLAERGLYLVTPLAGERLRQAIEGPATQAGLRIEPGLVDLLVRDCEGEPGALPLLSHALAETWQRRDGRVLTVEGYRATGEIRGAVARSADRLYVSLPVEQRAKLRSLLLRLVSSSADGEPVRSRVSTRTLGGDIERERVLGLLVRARLVTAEEDSVELAHEALARAWPRLRSWLDEDAAGQRILRHLGAAAEGWESLGRPATELYRGARLEATLEWQLAAAPDLTELEREFLDASTAEASAALERQADERRVHAHQRRRLRRALGAVAVLVVVATAGVLTAYRQREATQQERRDSAAAALASRSEVLRSGQGDVAALLAVEAHRIAPSAVTESALFSSFTGGSMPPRTRQTDVHLPFGAAAAFVPDSDILAIADRRGLVHLVDVDAGEDTQLAAIDNRNGYTELAVSSDGRYLAGLWREQWAQDHSMMTVWDLQTKEQRFEPVRIGHVSRSVTISNDGSQVVVAGGPLGPTQVRDGASGALQLELDSLPVPSGWGSSADTESVLFAPDGRLAVVSRTGVIRLIDAANGVELQRLDGDRGVVGEAASFSRSGSVLVTSGSSGFVTWDVEEAEMRSPERDSADRCRMIVYAEFIDAVLCPTVTGSVIALDVETGNEIRQFDAPPVGGCAIAVSPDGRRFVMMTSCASGAPAQLFEWRLDGGGPISHLAYRTSSPHHVERYGFGSDPSSLVAWIGTDDDETIVLDPATGRVIDRFADEYRLLQTDDPNVAIAVLADGSVVRFDVVRNVEVGPRVDFGFETENVWRRDGHVVARGHDEDGDSRLQGVDFESGQLVPPTIDSDGEFEIGWYDMTLDTLYLVVNRAGGDRIERRDITTGDLLQASTEAFVDFDLRAGVLVARSPDGRILELDAQSLEPLGTPFPGVVEIDGLMWLSEDAKRLMVADGVSTTTMRIYDVATRTLLGEPIVHERGPDLGWGAIRPDGLEAAVDTADGIVVWDLDPAHWVDAVCESVGRNLTQAEWNEYVGDLGEYRSACPEFPPG